MQRRSQWEPKNSIYKPCKRPEEHVHAWFFPEPTFGCSRAHLNRTSVWCLNSWINSRSESPAPSVSFSHPFSSHDLADSAAHTEELVMFLLAFTVGGPEALLEVLAEIDQPEMFL